VLLLVLLLPPLSPPLTRPPPGVGMPLSPLPSVDVDAGAAAGANPPQIPAATGIGDRNQRRQSRMGHQAIRGTKKDDRLTATDRVEELHAMILKSLDDDQAVDPVSIPLAGKTSIADYMVIASGRSGRQVASMATKIAEKVKADFGRSARVQGLPAADWVLIDCGDIIVHIFRPDVRSFYNLERMWGLDEAPNPSPAFAPVV
jgi:ribosome-associated protein